MDESRFLALMKRARACSYLGANLDYWKGYQRGLRRGFQGDMFGTDAEHERWLRLADEGADSASRERGCGYRDGLSACAAPNEDGALPGPAQRQYTAVIGRERLPASTGDPHALSVTI